MNKKRTIKYGLPVMLALVCFACTKDLDRKPTNSLIADVAYKDMEGYQKAVAKMYGSFGLTGNAGNGSSDLAGIDPGASDFLRLYWNVQELTTDEAICVWADPGVPDFHEMDWSSNNIILMGLYNRCIFQITICNEFLRESTEEKLAARGITAGDAEKIRNYRVEARFLRAFQYWVLMDVYGNPPFVTEETPVGKNIPPQIKRVDLFRYVEQELNAIEPLMAKARQNEYGRADEAAVWALKARMFLNAGVYLGAGNERYTDAMLNARKVIDAGYSLMPAYQHLFLTDNDRNNPEVIMPINYDAVSTENAGGTSFIINAGLGSPMNGRAMGMPGNGWGGNRVTKNLPLLFGDYVNTADSRSIFYTENTNPEIDNPRDFAQGIKVMKFKNIDQQGQMPVGNPNFSSVDFPLFRLAEMYLIYAEAVKRGATGGDEALALTYLNRLRERAYGNSAGNIASFNLAYIIDERGREFYWEAFRRTDLIRFGLFTTNTYLWPWKGGVKEGRGVEAYRNLFPLPASDIVANPGLVQNEGY